MRSSTTMLRRLRRTSTTLGTNGPLHRLDLRERLFLIQLPLHIVLVLVVAYSDWPTRPC